MSLCLIGFSFVLPSWLLLFFVVFPCLAGGAVFWACNLPDCLCLRCCTLNLRAVDFVRCPVDLCVCHCQLHISTSRPSLSFILEGIDFCCRVHGILHTNSVHNRPRVRVTKSDCVFSPAAWWRGRRKPFVLFSLNATLGFPGEGPHSGLNDPLNSGVFQPSTSGASKLLLSGKALMTKPFAFKKHESGRTIGELPKNLLLPQTNLSFAVSCFRALCAQMGTTLPCTEGLLLLLITTSLAPSTRLKMLRASTPKSFLLRGLIHAGFRLRPLFVFSFSRFTLINPEPPQSKRSWSKTICLKLMFLRLLPNLVVSRCWLLEIRRLFP